MVAAKPSSLMAMSALLAGLAFAGLAGCAMTHGRLTRSADRLEHDAAMFARDSRDTASQDYRTDYGRDARDLADQAHQFREAANDRRADDRDVKDAFDRLSRSYHSLRDDVDRSGSEVARADLRPVTQDYLDVERDMGGYAAPDRYAQDRDRSDQY